MPSQGRGIQALIGIIAAILIVAALRAAYVVAMPLVFALFLAVLVWPLHRRLRENLPRWLTVSVIMLVLAVIFAAGLGVVWLAARQVGQRGGQYADAFQHQLDAASAWFERSGIPLGQNLAADDLAKRATDMITHWLPTIWEGLALLSLIIFMLVLLLLEVNQWRAKSRQVFTSKTSAAVLDTIETIVDKLHDYLKVRVLMSAIAGVLTAGLCLLLGVDFALIWGMFAFALNFIPHVGSLISYIPPTLFALVQHDWKRALVVFLALGLTDMVMGNFVDPRISGRALKLSPLVTLAAVVFWGWLWGIAGAILAVPITASLVIICLHVKALKPTGQLLGEPGQK